MQDFEHEVREMVSQQTGMRPEKISRNSRLLQDLGIDGDDAVEFFEEFEKRFGPDLGPLYHHWARHFGPEGFGSPLSCLIMAVLILLAIPFMFLGVSPVWIWGAEIIALLLWVWPLKKWPLKDESIAVTVSDLVEAAHTKRWPIHYDDGDASTKG